MLFVIVLLLVPLVTTATFFQEDGDCPEVAVPKDFDLDQYISLPWHVQEQAVVAYQPEENFFCVRARYRKVGGWFGRTFWGYSVLVDNEAQDKDGKQSGGGGLCAYQTNKKEEPGKLAVAPCFLPRIFVGPYWVIAFEEGEFGYALVSGGQPTIKTENGCRTGDGINNSGLWIFTRQEQRNDTVVDAVRQIAVAQGFDVSVLLNVSQAGCVYNDRRRLGQIDV